MLVRHEQFAWNNLGGHISRYNPALSHYLGGIGLDPTQAVTAQVLGHELERQAAMLAYVDCFVLVMWSFLAMLPLLLFMRYRVAKNNPSSALIENAAT